MRHYRCDSPEAAARIVAACLLSDGHVGVDELEALDRSGMQQRLNMSRGQLLAVMQQMCEDLTTTAYLNWGDTCRLDPAVIFHLAQDVKDLRLRREIIALCNESACGRALLRRRGGFHSHVPRRLADAGSQRQAAFARHLEAPAIAGALTVSTGCRQPTLSRRRSAPRRGSALCDCSVKAAIARIRLWIAPTA